MISVMSLEYPVCGVERGQWNDVRRCKMKSPINVKLIEKLRSFVDAMKLRLCDKEDSDRKQDKCT
jgi:hypothetical protein